MNEAIQMVISNAWSESCFFLCINLSLDLKYFLGNFEVIIFASLIPDRDCDDMFVL